MHVGLSYDETLDVPLGDLLDLISVDMIKAGIVKEQKEEDFFEFLEKWR